VVVWSTSARPPSYYSTVVLDRSKTSRPLAFLITNWAAARLAGGRRGCLRSLGNPPTGFSATGGPTA
jgi:hypothetical protein